MLSVLLRFAQMAGDSVDVYYPSFKATGRKDLELLRDFCSLDNLYPIPVFEKVPHFVRTLRLAQKLQLQRKYDAYLALGFLDLALPLLRHQKPFSCWIATTHRAELEGMGIQKWRHYLLYNRFTNRLTWSQENRAARGSRQLLAISRATAGRLQAEFDIPANQVARLPIPVRVNLFVPSDCPPESPPYLLSVARLERRKDFPTLLLAFREILRSHREVRLHIVGEGPDRSLIELETQRLDLHESVTFLGRISQSDLISQYQGATLFTLASRQEGLGLVFLEAMSCGLPIVTTDSGGSADPVLPDQTGFLVPVGDWRALARYCCRILEDETLRKRLSQAAREQAVAEYSFESFCRRFQPFYRNLFQQQPTSKNPG